MPTRNRALRLNRGRLDNGIAALKRPEIAE